MRKEGRKEKKYVRLPFKTKAKMKRKSQNESRENWEERSEGKVWVSRGGMGMRE